MVEINTSKPVLVTGATGYLAGWIVKGLLEKGITVYAAIRDVDYENKRQHLDKIANESNGNIKYFETDFVICDKNREKAKKHFHTTQVEAMEIADEANVKRLILTHFSRSLSNKEVSNWIWNGEKCVIFDERQVI